MYWSKWNFKKAISYPEPYKWARILYKESIRINSIFIVNVKNLHKLKDHLFVKFPQRTIFYTKGCYTKNCFIFSLLYFLTWWHQILKVLGSTPIVIGEVLTKNVKIQSAQTKIQWRQIWNTFLGNTGYAAQIICYYERPSL